MLRPKITDDPASPPLSRRTRLLSFCFLLAFATLLGGTAIAQRAARPFRVVALAEKGGIHKPFVDAAKVWLAREARRDGFTVEYLENTNRINDRLLSHCDLFLQLNYPPYNWTTDAQNAFVRYIDEGKGGWIGFHHASLLGSFDGFSVWPWFQDFMGGILFKDYIRTFATATVHVEAPEHPVMRSVPSTFAVQNEEWYTWSQSPRTNVQVLARVDEDSYRPDTSIKMGDHPVIWTNPQKKARNVYFFMGHHPELFQNTAFTQMFHNAITWAAQK
ncbi:ThuA domain-containing protein [Terriglobus aquaticus]|uniref:ThuA domain-containing protein n=1 Tax=Terriglobus aquaticus TaxID=940139 RepID=A0ABW9KK65_9BACT|nr:ThuA domain-containing protein [Terriglobus aquaticus]